MKDANIQIKVNYFLFYVFFFFLRLLILNKAGGSGPG